MKAVILTILMCALYLAIVSVAFRVARSNIRTAAVLTRLFVATVPVAVAIFLLTPADLGFLPASLIERPTWELPFLLFLWGSAFFGGILQVYALADRGFSLRITIDIDKAGGCMTVDEVLRSYSAGKGTSWMYRKRIDGLAALKLIETREGELVITAAGRRAARRLAFLRTFLRVEAQLRSDGE